MADIRSFFKSLGSKKDDEPSCSSSVSSSTANFSSPPTSHLPFDETSSDSSSSLQASMPMKKKRRIEGFIEKPEELEVDANIIIEHLLQNKSDLMTLGQLDSWWNDAKSIAVKDVNKISPPSWIKPTVKLPTFDKDDGIFNCCATKDSCLRITEHWIQVHSGLKLFRCKFCISKNGGAQTLIAHIKKQHPSKATPEYLNEVKEECKNNSFVMEFSSYLQSVKEISDKFLPKEEKRNVRGRIVDTKISFLDSNAADSLYSLYKDGENLRQSLVNGRVFPCFSTEFVADSKQTKCQIMLAGSSTQKNDFVYVLPSVVVNTKTFQVTFGHGKRHFSNQRSPYLIPPHTSLARSMRGTLFRCASNADQYQKGGIRLLPEFASIFLFYKIRDTPKGLEHKDMGEDLKNICRNIAKDRGLAFSFNYFSVGKSAEETKTVINNQLDLYLEWLTVAYDKFLIDEIAAVSN